MPKSRNQKLKLLYIKEILEKQSDENNKLLLEQTRQLSLFDYNYDY